MKQFAVGVLVGAVVVVVVAVVVGLGLVEIARATESD